MKEELSEWRDLYHANGRESSTVKIVIPSKVSCKFNVISIKITFECKYMKVHECTMIFKWKKLRVTNNKKTIEKRIMKITCSPRYYT